MTYAPAALELATEREIPEIIEEMAASETAGISEIETGLEGGLRPAGFAYNATLEMDRTTLDRAIEIMATQELNLDDLSPELQQRLEPLFDALDQVQQITGIELENIDRPEVLNSFMMALQDPSVLASLDRAGLYQLSLKIGNMPSLGALGPNMRAWTLSESRDGATALQSSVAANYAGRQSAGARVDLGDKAGGPQVSDGPDRLVMGPKDIDDAMTRGPVANLPQMTMSLAS